MAVGNIQNRLDSSMQDLSATSISKDRLKQPQINAGLENSADKMKISSDTDTKIGNQLAKRNMLKGQQAKVNIAEQRINDLSSNRNTFRNRSIEIQQKNPAGKNSVTRKREENALLNTGSKTVVSIIQKPTTANPAKKGVGRTAKAQIQQIEKNNAASAGTPPRTQASNVSLVQENQLGSRLNVTG